MTDWRDFARCADAAPLTFHPVDEDDALLTGLATWIAQSYCQPCPVRRQCGTSAVERGADRLVQAGAYWHVLPDGGQVAVQLLPTDTAA